MTDNIAKPEFSLVTTFFHSTILLISFAAPAPLNWQDVNENGIIEIMADCKGFPQQNRALYDWFSSLDAESLAGVRFSENKWLGVNAAWQMLNRSKEKSKGPDYFLTVDGFLGFLQGKINAPLPIEFTRLIRNGSNDENWQFGESDHSYRRSFERTFEIKGIGSVVVKGNSPYLNWHGEAHVSIDGLAKWDAELWELMDGRGQSVNDLLFSEIVMSKDGEYIYFLGVHEIVFYIVEFETKTGKRIGGFSSSTF